MIQDCDTLDLIWLSAAGETAPAILQHMSREVGSAVVLLLLFPASISPHLCKVTYQLSLVLPYCNIRCMGIQAQKYHESVVLNNSYGSQSSTSHHWHFSN